LISAGAVGTAPLHPLQRTSVASAASRPAQASTTPSYRGIRCPEPVGWQVTQCRLGIHGAADLSRRSWAALGREVTVSVAFSDLAANAAMAGARDWPLVDSLGQPMGRLVQNERGRVRIEAVDGSSFSVVAIASELARSAFTTRRGGGTECEPSMPARGRARRLTDPAVGAAAHARLSNGALNTVTEYDAKAPFGGTVYFMSNTTSVRVGTPVRTADRFRFCDPNSDGTLTWRYVAITTGVAERPALYGWIPARCPARMRR
jgi:hypothetical protein